MITCQVIAGHIIRYEAAHDVLIRRQIWEGIGLRPCRFCDFFRSFHSCRPLFRSIKPDLYHTVHRAAVDIFDDLAGYHTGYFRHCLECRNELLVEPFISLFDADAFRITDGKIPAIIRSVHGRSSGAFEILFPWE